MKVLVADDSKPIRDRLVERLLRLPDVQVAEAVDTTEALQKMHSFHPAVVVLDIRMPGGGGIKALFAIKKDFPAVTVIMMTSYPYAQYRRKCLEAGADFFFDKSTEFEQVAETICQLMQTGDVSGVGHRTATAQLVAAKEEFEKATQRQRDMSILSLLRKPTTRADRGYAMWEKTFDAMPDMVAILDAEHTIVRVNKAMADRLDLPAAELTGKKCFEYMHGTHCPIGGCPHEALLKDHKEHVVEIYNEHLGGWFEISVSPIFERNQLIGVIHIAHDITARHKAAELIAVNELRYRQLFESMQTGFALHEILCDENGVPCDYRFLEVNSAFEALTGLKAENIVGRTVKEVMPSVEFRWIETYGKVALTGESTRIEDFSDALGRHYSVSAYSPSPGRFATIFTDITEQKEAEGSILRARDVAEEANRAKTQFLANISHELRTPLNAVIGLSELLVDSPLNEEQLDYVQTINTSGEDLLTIIADLLDLSKIEMGKLKVKTEPFAIRSVVEKSMALLTPLAEKKGLAFSAVVNASVQESMTADADRLQQVLINLLNNAIKFTEAGFVRLLVEECTTPTGSRCVEFLVEDSGCGMDSETMKRIFEPFQQGDNSTTREHGGSGLGLAISKNLVEMMGGSIRVESCKDKGSGFHFHLIGGQAAPQQQVPVGDVRDQWRGRSACVWGDDPADMRAAEVFLERIGVMPRYKTNLDEINLILNLDDPADVVLCNLDMPGLQERLLEFRKIRPDVPWIGFSNWMTPIDEQIKSCFSGFGDRPLKAEQLYGALMKILESEK